MSIAAIVIIYIFSLIGECLLSSFKKFYLGLFIPIVTSIVFLATLDESLYQLLFWEAVVFILMRAAIMIVREKANKKKQSKLNKTKIKDL